MPNVHGTYTLTEAAHEIGTTSAFINRIQKETGIGGEVGTKGRLASFSMEEVEIFKRIKILRMLDFSFKDIKEIWATEAKLIDMWRRNVIEKYVDSKESDSEKYKVDYFPLVIHSPIIEVRLGYAVGEKSGSVKENELTRQFYEVANKMITFSGIIRKRMEAVRDIQERMLDKDDARLANLKEVFKFWAGKGKS